MAISNRGVGQFAVYVYDPTIKRKRYVGVYATREAAAVAESDAKASFRRCSVCKKRYLPPRDERYAFRCSPECLAVRVVKNKKPRSTEAPTHWVYICRRSDGRVIYVGLTSGGFRRHREHSYAAPWWGEVRRIEVEHCATRDGAVALERELVRKFDPQHNVLLRDQLPKTG